MVLIHSFHPVLFVPRVILKASTRERYCCRFAACLVMVSQVCPLPSSLFPWFFARSPWDDLFFASHPVSSVGLVFSFTLNFCAVSASQSVFSCGIKHITYWSTQRTSRLEVRTPDRHRSVCGSTSACLDSRRRYGIGRSGEDTPEEGTASQS